jgi:hypothetical protein
MAKNRIGKWKNPDNDNSLRGKDLPKMRTEFIRNGPPSFSHLVREHPGEAVILRVKHNGQQEAFAGFILKARGVKTRTDVKIKKKALANNYQIRTSTLWRNIGEGDFINCDLEPLYLHMPRLISEDKSEGRMSWEMQDVVFSDLEEETQKLFGWKNRPNVQVVIGSEECKKFLEENRDVVSQKIKALFNW